MGASAGIGASASSASTIYPGVRGLSAVGQGAIANQTAGFAPLVSASGGAAAGGGGGGFSPLFALMAVQSLGTLATSYASAKGAEMAGDFNASIYESNARIQAIKAEDAINRGRVESLKARRLAKSLIGSQRAAAGAQGIDPDADDLALIQGDTAALGKEESMIIENNAWKEAWGYRVAENDLYGKAKYSRLTGKATARNTILTGGLSIAKNIATASYLDKSRSFYAGGDSALFGGGF